MNQALPTAQDLLAGATRVHAVGPRPGQERSLGKTIKKMVQTGVLGTLVALQLLAGLPSPAQAQQLMGPPAATQVQKAQQAFQGQDGIELVIPFKDITSAQHVIKDNGTLDAFALVQSWRDNDIDMINIIKMVEILNLTQSPTFVRSQQDKDNVLSMAQRAAGLFEVTTNAQAIQVIDGNDFHNLEDAGVLSEGAAMTNARDYMGDPDFDHLMKVWDHSSQLYEGGDSAPLEAQVDDQSMPAAIKMVREAMNESGLSSVKILLPMWTSGVRIHSVGQHLKNANQELQQLTGWDGQVLGLKGQVDLTIGTPYYGAYTQLGKGDQIQIQTQFSEMAHEWLHAVEASVVMAQNPDVSFDNIVQVQHLHGDTWVQLTNEIKDISSKHAHSFEHRMDVLAQRNRADGETSYMATTYYESTMERVAYQFGSFVTATMSHGEHTLDHSSNTTDHNDRAPRPSVEEGQSTAPAWSKVFTSLKGDYWASLPEATPKQAPMEMAFQAPDIPSMDAIAPSTLSASSLQSWRSKRQADPTHEPHSPNRLSFR